MDPIPTPPHRFYWRLIWMRWFTSRVWAHWWLMTITLMSSQRKDISKLSTVWKSILESWHMPRPAARTLWNFPLPKKAPIGNYSEIPKTLFVLDRITYLRWYWIHEWAPSRFHITSDDSNSHVFAGSRAHFSGYERTTPVGPRSTAILRKNIHFIVYPQNNPSYF
jgi:hypothetical protein